MLEIQFCDGEQLSVSHITTFTSQLVLQLFLSLHLSIHLLAEVHQSCLQPRSISLTIYFSDYAISTPLLLFSTHELSPQAYTSSRGKPNWNVQHLQPSICITCSTLFGHGDLQECFLFLIYIVTRLLQLLELSLSFLGPF